MLVEAVDVSAGRGVALPPTSLSFRTGEAAFARVETAQRPTVLGLVVTGRMRTATGHVHLDGSPDRRGLRRRLALVDAPDVSEPATDVSIAGVVAEELMFAGRVAHPRAVTRALEQLGLAGRARHPLSSLAPLDRIRMLTELALLRPGVEGLVLVSPDRHGGDPARWWDHARRLAARDLAVLVVAGQASGAALDANAGHPPTSHATDEVEPLFPRDWSLEEHL